MPDILPCPFCGSEIVHKTVVTDSYDLGKRKFDEWHHAKDDLDCPVRRHGRIIASGLENSARTAAQLDRWNARIGIIKDFA